LEEDKNEKQNRDPTPTAWKPSKWLGITGQTRAWERVLPKDDCICHPIILEKMQQLYLNGALFFFRTNSRTS